MSFPILLDRWKYDDKECERLIQQLWWNRTPQPIAFTQVGESDETQEGFVEQIAICLLEFVPKSVSVKAEALTVEFNVKKLDNEKWCAVAFIERVRAADAIDESSIAVSFIPVQNSVIEHLKIWIALRLWD